MALVNLGGEQKGSQAIGRVFQELEAWSQRGKSLILPKAHRSVGKFHNQIPAFFPESR